MAEEATFPLLTRTTLAPLTLAPEASVTTPWMDAAGHSVANAVNRVAANTGRNARLRRPRKYTEIGMIAPSFPSERKWVRAFRTGLLTCAFSSHLPKSEPKGFAFSGFLGRSALGGTALAEILPSSGDPIRRAPRQGRSQLRGSGGVSPPSRAS